jgi:xylulokinase
MMFLGIDLGTSGVKAVVLDEHGAILAQSSAALTVASPRPSWSEQDPADWWAACDTAVFALPPEIRRKVSAIGLSGQMHGAVLLGEARAVLRPAILWNDGRSHAQCAELEQRVPASRAITGNIAMAGFTAPKLLWVAENEPEIFARIDKVVLPKDYLRLMMTGDLASDLSDSAGTLWLDVGARDWSDAMLAATGLARRHMPTLHEGTEATGQLLPAIAARWGMERVIVAAGAGDNAAGATGMGIIGEGDAMLSLGTSGVIFVATDGFRPNPQGAVHAFCHCLPGMWHQMAVHLSAASCLPWAATQLGLSGPAQLLELAATPDAQTGSEVFLPFLNGERTPHNDPSLRAGWLFCDSATSPARLAAAVLEGVAFAHADGLAVLRAAGSRVDRLVVVGGGARSALWGRIIAAALDVELAYCDGAEVGPALGAARLARIALTGEAPAAVCTAPRVHHIVTPDQQLRDRLVPGLARYRMACQAIMTAKEPT